MRPAGPQTGQPRWALRPLPPDYESLRQQLGKRFQLHPLTAQLLLQRGFRDEEAIERFLRGTLSHLPNPFDLPDMDRAVNRLLDAFIHREKILFFGDYDVDGITGAAQMQSYFREMGLPTRVLLPHRLHEGYGLTEASVKKIAAERPDLVVAIDNGTKSRSEIGVLKSLGIDVIVVDHHETPSIDQRPDVVALVNPKSDSSCWTERDIASAGLVFLLLMAFRSRCREKGITPLPNLKRYLDLAALGTIADIVPLVGTNRILVQFGLEEIAATSRPGLRALCNAASVRAPLSTSSVAFRLAPRINAAGRLGDPMTALNLLLAETESEAEPLVQELEQLNRERQRIEERMTAEAIAMVEEGIPDRVGLVVAKAGWHLGVVGIVASKLVERFGRPSIVLALSEDGLEARGSGRTVPGFSIHDALTRIETEMIRFGGHAAAAGMTVDASNLSRFAEKFDASVREDWGKHHSPTVIVDAELPLREVRSSLLQELSLLEPHGPGNPEPIFIASQVTLEESRLVGSGERGPRHLKTVLSQDGTRIEAIGFNLGTYAKEAKMHKFHEIAFSPQFNEWNGNKRIQAMIKRIEPTT